MILRKCLQIDEQRPLLFDRNSLGTAFAASNASRLLFYWVNPLFLKGKSYSIFYILICNHLIIGLEQKLKDPDDLYDLPVNMTSRTIGTKIDKALIGNVDKFAASEQIPRINGKNIR
jgi:hypothetical protein